MIFEARPMEIKKMRTTVNWYFICNVKIKFPKGKVISPWWIFLFRYFCWPEMWNSERWLRQSYQNEQAWLVWKENTTFSIRFSFNSRNISRLICRHNRASSPTNWNFHPLFTYKWKLLELVFLFFLFFFYLYLFKKYTQWKISVR